MDEGRKEQLRQERAEVQKKLLLCLAKARAALEAGDEAAANRFCAEAEAASARWTALGDLLRSFRCGVAA